MSPREDEWLAANQRYLMAHLARLRAALRRRAGLPAEAGTAPEQLAAELEAAARALSGPAALDALCAAFALSPFERDVVLLAAGMELDGAWGGLCAAAQGSDARAYPSFGLALAALPDAHWTALTPAAPLRRWRLLEVSGAEALIAGRIALDERVLHYLAGVSYLDDRLAALLRSVPGNGELAPSHLALARTLAAGVAASLRAGRGGLVHLAGTDATAKPGVAAAAAARLGLRTYALATHHVPASAAERTALARLWERDARLAPAALCVEAGDGDAGREPAEFLEAVEGVVFVCGAAPLRLAQRSLLRYEVDIPQLAERRVLWRKALGRLAGRCAGELDALASHFHLTPAALRAVAAQLGAGTARKGGTAGESGDAGSEVALRRALWQACRREARVHLDELAQRVEPVARYDDLVLPLAHKRTLRDIVAQVRRRATVYDDWGFAAKAGRGLGISALFSGPSGTGKTMAAEVLANELGLDLYRIDLSQVVSKYIGETEKNLRRVFDAAEAGGAILLFDEADALFGKRSDVKDSHDRYANIEVSYLLQRMEAYHGLAILTTNLKSALDQAFLRRIRFVIHFPFPDLEQRAEIWQRILPQQTPREGVEVARLARLNVAGGNIRNIALGAAFLAADAGEPVRMSHLLHAARAEAAKLERPLTEAEIGGWA
jgi:hypothetical protein